MYLTEFDIMMASFYDGMFKLTTINKLNMAAATMLYFDNLYSPLMVVKYIKLVV